MMGAASLPNPQASTPPGFAAFLSTIGQAPTGGGQDGGFGQLLAAIPPLDAAAPKPSPLTSVEVATATAGVPATATGEAVAKDVSIEAPVANAEVGARSGDPDAVAASAAKLLIELNGSAAKPDTKALKADETEAKADGPPALGNGTETAKSDTKALNAREADAKSDGPTAAENGTKAAKPAELAAAPATPPTPLAATAQPIAAPPIAAAVVVAVAGKPVKAGDTSRLPISAAAPTVEAAISAPDADKPRNAAAKTDVPDVETAVAAPAAGKPRAAPLPSSISAGAAPITAKSADAAPSMTIQFAQPMTTGAAMLANASAPVAIAERVLDLGSDGAWIDQLAHDIAATKSDSGDISFRLLPRNLGRLDVAMVMGDEGVSLKLDTQHEATATIVTAAQGRLVEDLRQQGVRVAGSEVTCTPGDTSRHSQGQGRAAAHDVSHLIETVTERVKARDPEEAADRRGRFA